MPKFASEEKIRGDLLPKLEPVIHYLFIVNQILVQVLNSGLQVEFNYNSLAIILEQYKIKDTNFDWVEFIDNKRKELKVMDQANGYWQYEQLQQNLPAKCRNVFWKGLPPICVNLRIFRNNILILMDFF